MSDSVMVIPCIEVASCNGNALMKMEPNNITFGLSDHDIKKYFPTFKRNMGEAMDVYMIHTTDDELLNE